LVLRQGAQTISAPESTTELSDEDLVIRAEAGERAAVGLLFDRYSDLIFDIGLRILHDRGEAEDLVQDVFLSLFEKVKGFNPSKGCGRTWIVQIAYRRAFDRRAYLTRRSFYNGTDVERVKNTLEGAMGLEDQIADLVTGEQLHAAFEELNEKQRKTLQMYFFEGLDLREISEHLGETLENTRHYYYRGLERLRKVAATLARHRGHRET
jgi:RNA polymerase sigma-70 factor (ECF subfamily)